MACFKHPDWLPSQDMYWMYKISEPLGRVGEELKGVERKRDIITKFNTFEVQNLIPCSLPDWIDRYPLWLPNQKLSEGPFPFILKKKKKKKRGWIKMKLVTLRRLTALCGSSTISGSQWLTHYLSYLMGKQSKYLLWNMSPGVFMTF